MENQDERARLFLPFAALEGLEALLALQEEDAAEGKKDEFFEIPKKVQKNNADTC